MTKGRSSNTARMPQSCNGLAPEERADILRVRPQGALCNPILRGWVQYYGQYYKSALYPTFLVLDRILVKWAMRKYKKLKGHQRRATHWLGRIARREPRLFVHWQMGVGPAAGR